MSLKPAPSGVGTVNEQPRIHVGRGAGRWVMTRFWPSPLVPRDLWLTHRRSVVEPLDYWWSEARPGVWPCVQAYLDKWTIHRWGAEPTVVWEIRVEVQVRRVLYKSDKPLCLDDQWVYGEYMDAINDWREVCQTLRRQLV